MTDFIQQYPNVLSQEFCKKLIDFFCLADQQGYTYKKSNQKFLKDDTNLNLNFFKVLEVTHESFFSYEIMQVLKNAIIDYGKKFEIINAFNNLGIYTIKLQRTEVGEGYHIWHCETDGREVCNRILAWTIYLNDVEEGGETEFLYQHKRIKPQTGNLVIWPAGFTHVHRGNPPISNTKYILTGWVEF